MTGGVVPSTNANNGDEDEAICCRSSHETDDGALDSGRRDLGTERLLSSRSLGLEDILEEETKEGDVQKTMDKSANRKMEKSSRRMLMDQTNSTHSRMAKLKRQNSKKISVGKVPRKKEPKEINWLRDTLSLNSSHTGLAYQKEFFDDESVAGDGSSPRHNKKLDTVLRQQINPLSKDLSLAFPKEKLLPQSLFSKVTSTSTCDESLSSVSNEGLENKTATRDKVRETSEEPSKHAPPLWISIEPPEPQSTTLPTKEQTCTPLSDQSRAGGRPPKESWGGQQTPVEGLGTRGAGPYNRQTVENQYYSSHHSHRERESYSGGIGVVRADHWQQQPPSVSRCQSGHSFSSRPEHCNRIPSKDSPPPPSPPQGSRSSSFSSAGCSTPYGDTLSGYNRVNFVSEHDRYGRYSTDRHHSRYYRHHDDVRRGRYNHEDHGRERDHGRYRDGHGYNAYQPGLDNHRHQDSYQESDYLDTRRTMYQDSYYESHDRPRQHRVSSSREERHLDQKASTVRPADDETVMVEIEPGFTVPLRNAAETFEAVSNDFYTPVMCLACSCDIFCLADVQFVICPGCRVMSPVEGDYFEGRRVTRHGLGLGFTCDSLFKMQSDIIARTRPKPNGYNDSRSVAEDRKQRESGRIEHVHHVPYHDHLPQRQQTAPRQHVFVHG